MTKSDPIAIGWKNSVFLKSLAHIEKLKNSKGLDLWVCGSGQLVQAAT